MARPLTIAIAAVAFVAMLAAFPASSEEVSLAQVARPDAFGPRYDFGPRIIHVPQPGDEEAAYAPDGRASLDDDADAVEPAPPPRRQSGPRPQPRAGSAVPPAPRRKPYAAPQPGPAERRTVLTAPVHDGPTPVRPTARYARETGVKFAPAPPPGYMPPAQLPPELPQETASDASPSE